MKISASLSISFVLLLALAAEAALPTVIIDFDDNPFLESNINRFGGPSILDSDHGVALNIESIQFVNNNITGFTFPLAGPEFFPHNIGFDRYLSHGNYRDFAPTNKRAYSLRVNPHFLFGESGDLFDLVSIDVANFNRSTGTNFQYLPATVQLNTSSIPSPYERGTAVDNWVSINSPGKQINTPQQINYETILLADSTEPGFPVDKFTGIRSAFLGLDDVRAIDNIAVRWSRENFNAPTTFEVVEQELSEGLVVDGSAIYHRPDAIELSGNNGPVTVTTTERRVFRWNEDTKLTSNFPLRIGGEWESRMIATDGGLVELEQLWTFKRLSGGSIGSGISRTGIKSVLGQQSEKAFNTLSTQFYELGSIVPGAEYELITTFNVTVDPRGGYAAAFFDKGWEVRIAGVRVPEPASFLLTLSALIPLATLRMRSQKTVEYFT